MLTSMSCSADFLPSRLWPTRRARIRQVCVLHGLGGIGKTQLAIDFARRYKATFSAIFWLDGRSEDQLKQSFARCLGRIPELRTASRTDLNLNSEEDLNVIVMKVIEWLTRPSNTQWLLIFNNINQDQQQGDYNTLLELLQGLPLALAQATSYLQSDDPLTDYNQGSIATT
ncbi:unnamed protein product [Clonostachys solani]|uniref:NB-ARC domain-containing protein n=1 Tax=Clonostachys solani TaxID=160281 RepID=A0A9P0EPF9_9HYPO|nr:unnamed protein product [Clonostachys solani]